MRKHTSNYKIEVIYKARDELERRQTVNCKLAQIINLESGLASGKVR